MNWDWLKFLAQTDQAAGDAAPLKTNTNMNSAAARHLLIPEVGTVTETTPSSVVEHKVVVKKFNLKHICTIGREYARYTGNVPV